MLTSLIRYNPVAKHILGSSVTIPDALSRSPDSSAVSDTKLTEEVESHFASNIPISNVKLKEIVGVQEATAYTLAGVKGAPEELHPYFSVCNNLYVAENILLMENSIVIPKSLRQNTLVAIHQDHWCFERCKSIASPVVW